MTTEIECVLCHAVHSDPGGNPGGAWRCNRCGQHWDPARIAVVLEYQRWVKAEAAAMPHAAGA